MAFSEHRGQLLIKVLCLLLITSCRKEVIHYYQAEAIQTMMKDGLLFAEGQPVNGIIYELDSTNEDTLYRVEYKDGLENGLHKFWYPGGQLKEVHYYINGKKTGIHIGYWPDGKKRFEYHFKDDLYEGLVEDWFGNGKICKRQHFKDGHEDGLQQVWADDGTPLANYEARNGRNYGNIGVKHCSSKVKK